MAENRFYDAILNAGADMQKTASEHDILAALESSDLSEDELNKLASDLEDALNAEDIDDIDDVLDDEGVEDTDAEDVDTEDEEGTTDDTDVDDVEDVEDDTDTEDAEDAEDVDIESLAAAYEAEYEKYASEGLTTRDYVYGQVEDAEFAAVVGDMAEKLAFVADLPVFLVADDLISTISNKISAAENQED